MSRQRRNFSAKFKSDLVIELLKGEKDLNTLAVENNIQPNLLRNWKKEFLSSASVVFDDKREDNIKEKLAEERKEKQSIPSMVRSAIMHSLLSNNNFRKACPMSLTLSLSFDSSSTNYFFNFFYTFLFIPCLSKYFFCCK